MSTTLKFRVWCGPRLGCHTFTVQCCAKRLAKYERMESARMLSIVSRSPSRRQCPSCKAGTCQKEDV
jgi:hypothetical protein